MKYTSSRSHARFGLMIPSINDSSGRKTGYLRPSDAVAGGRISNCGEGLLVQDGEVAVGDWFGKVEPSPVDGSFGILPSSANVRWPGPRTIER